MPAKSALPSPNRYLELVHAFPLRPIHSEADLDRAIAIVDSLIDHTTLTRDEEDYLHVLSNLVEEYEDEDDPIPDAPGPEMLRFLLEENSLTLLALGEQAGIPISTLSEVLSGKRKISPAVREKLAKRFHTDPSLFL